MVLRSWLRVALIDLRFDLRRFGVLLACLALGVATIAAVGSVGASLDAAIGRDARAFLGGDLEASIGYRPASAAELKLFRQLGRVTAVVEIAGQAHAGDKGTLIGLRAVDEAYPLVGAVEVTAADGGAASLARLLERRDGLYGAAADPLLFDRLGVKPGDIVEIGSERYRLTGTLVRLPDEAVRGLQLGATVLVSAGSLPGTGLIGPGVLVRYRYKIALAGSTYEAAAARIRSSFPDAGWQILSPREATAGLTRYLDLFDRFLVLVGLSSLLVGGIGVSNAVTAYVNERERSIATMMSLGATSARVLVHFLVQVMLLGLLGTAIGLLLGIALTALALPLLGGYLGIVLPASVHGGPLVLAAGYGLTIAFVFAYLPLLRAAGLRPGALFRVAGGVGGGGLGLMRRRASWPMLGGTVVLAGLMLATTQDPKLVGWYVVGVAVTFLVLRAAAAVLRLVFRRLPVPRSLVVRLAWRNIHRVGAPTATVMLSLGLGLTLMLSIALVEGSVRGQLAGEISGSAPSFVLINVDKPTVAAIEAFAKADADVASVDFVPFLRGIVTAIDGRKIADDKGLDALAKRRLGGDQALSWRADLPEGDRVLSGSWWSRGYDGPPLLSLDEDFARPLGLKVGDSLTVALSGRPIVARIANIRQVKWQNASLSFAILFSPGLIEAAPATAFGALKVRPGRELAVEGALVRQFPALGFIPVGAALAQISGVIGALANAVALVGAVALVSGVFVLAGALAAGRRQREADAVVAKVLGATRRQIGTAFLIEYGVLGLIAGLAAAGLGAAAGWALTTHLLQLRFLPDWRVVLGVALGAVIVATLAGLATTWSTLSRSPASFLRAEE